MNTFILVAFFSYAAYMAGMEYGKTEERQQNGRNIKADAKKLQNCLAVIRGGK